MLRMKAVFAASLVIAIAAIVPQAQAQTATAKAIIAGSTAIWQSMALAAYNNKGGTAAPGGSCISTAFVSPCFHYTFKSTATSGFQATDTRPTKKGGTAASDFNTIWIVWDSHTTTAGQAPNYIAYIKVDSVVGDRCYYAQPRCNLNAIGGVFPPATTSQIAVWPDNSADVTPPTSLQNNFTAASGILVSAAATDVRAEDGAFAMCRANSIAPSPLDAHMKGLGYNANNTTPGQCPTSFGLTNLGAPDITDTQGSTAHILAFNVTGSDPYSNSKIVAGTTVPAGAAPMVFIIHSLAAGSPLSGVTGVTDTQLQNLFANSAPGCDGTTLGGTSGNIDAWLREPLSGTYNTTEYNVFSYPDFSGTSQEAFLNVSSSGGNPLNQTCPGGGGNRIRGVGTSHVIDTGMVTDTTNDSIAYTFAGFGNWKKAADTSCSGNHCHYVTLNGVDPIFHKYAATSTTTPKADPGQPGGQAGGFAGELPSAADTPCKQLPCLESQIWNGGLSYPNLRSGQYSAWSVVRLISDATVQLNKLPGSLSTIQALAAASQIYNVINTPDFVPIVSVAKSGSSPGDPGLQLLRSHYQEVDALGTKIGGAPVNDASTGDVGGDVGGCIEHATPGTASVAVTDSTIGLIHTTTGTECSFAPTSH